MGKPHFNATGSFRRQSSLHIVRKLMSDNGTCPIWGTQAKIDIRPGGLALVDSPRSGGKYIVTDAAEALLKHFVECQKACLTTWLIDQRRLGDQSPEIDSKTIEDAKQWQVLPVPERANRLLRYLSQLEQYAGGGFRFSQYDPEDRFLRMQAWVESVTSKLAKDDQDEEINFFLKYLDGKGWIEKEETSSTHHGFKKRLTVAGYAHLDELDSKVVVSSQAFVAMWFDKSMDAALEEGIYPAIEDAGYKPFRIDKKEHSNKIDDEIIAEIRRSRFIVADFTHGNEGPRGGVYYEAGFAHGLNIPVIFTCRKDGLDNIHFDTRQYPHIVWKTPEQLRGRLAKRIGAVVIGDRPLKDNN